MTNLFNSVNCTEKTVDRTVDRAAAEKSETRSELNKLKFYHGVQTKEDVMNIMKEARIGDFLIRAKMLKNEVALSLFFCVKVTERDNEIHHYLIDFIAEDIFILRQETNSVSKDKKKCTDSMPFSSYGEMISYFTHHRLSCGIRLGRALRRPKWQLRHTNVSFEESGKLGSGNFCVVYHGKVCRKGESWKEAAIKISKLTDKDPATMMETRNLLVAEAKMMINYNHTHVVKLYGLACDMPPFMVCLEFCCGGTLESLLYKYGKDMEEFEKQVALFEAARGMRYLHTQKCVHRDLASRNCLIDSDGHVKIADFGLSKSLAANQMAFKEALKEAPLVWLAPECIQKESEFSSKTDVWAFGVLIYEVYFNGEKPFANEKNDGVIVKAIRKAKMPTLEDRTKIVKMQNLLSAIWVRKPEERPDFQKILEMLGDMFESPTVDMLKTFQMNQLKGVTRKKLPNTNYKDDDVAVASNPNFELSDRGKKKERKREKEKILSSNMSSNKGRKSPHRKSSSDDTDENHTDRTPVSKKKTTSSKKPLKFPESSDRTIESVGKKKTSCKKPLKFAENSERTIESTKVDKKKTQKTRKKSLEKNGTERTI